MAEDTQQIVVLGGGITGLSAAYQLNRVLPDRRVQLLEATGRLGGVIQTSREKGYLIEHAADNFLRGPSAPWAEELCREIGFADQLISTDESGRGAEVAWNGRLYPVPAGFQLMAPARFWPVLTSRLLSWSGKLRLCCEPLVREPAQEQDESLSQFATRRLGAEACQRLVEPLVSGIYTSDPDQLSVKAALPQMVRMAREHGSLYRAMRARQRQQRAADNARGARYGLFVAPRGGMSDFVEAVAQKVRERTEIRCHAEVEAIRRGTAARWEVIERNGRVTPGQAVIIALPAPAAAQVVASELPALSVELREIPCANSAVVIWGLRTDQLARPLGAFGCVIPPKSQRPVVAISYTSRKYPGRAPEGRVMLRSFIGGALHPDLAARPDDELHEIARRELSDLLGFSGEPEMQRIVRWPNTMPQYHVGHVARLGRIAELLPDFPGLHLAGNAYEGVGVPQCVRSGRAAADRVAAELPAASARA